MKISERLSPARLAPDALKARVAGRLGRSDRSALGLWFWEIDRVLMLLVFILISIGLIAVAAGSSASAQRYSGGSLVIAPLYYFWRQLAWAAVGVPVMIGISMLSVPAARRLALAGAAFFSVLLVAVPIFGHEVNGATRWIGVGAAGFQPSEFLKPCFVVALAWILSLKSVDRSLPVVPITGLLTAVVAIFLMKQPDFGQTIIFVCMWVALLMLAGLSFKILIGLGLGGIVGLVCAYLFYPVARLRIDNFLYRHGDTYQVDTAHATLTGGGLFGTGPGGGRAKYHLPEAHTDYVFSVIGEEFGLIACIAIALLFLALVTRVIVKLLDEEDQFVTLAAAGLTVQFALQALINMAVNVQIAPSKGMTLPFISYGGSSMLALCLGFGLLLAFTRRNPFLLRSPYVVQQQNFGIRGEAVRGAR